MLGYSEREFSNKFRNAVRTRYVYRLEFRVLMSFVFCFISCGMGGVCVTDRFESFARIGAVARREPAAAAHVP